MLEIKTIIERLDRVTHFDEMINNALAEGWELVRRDVLPPMAMRNGDQTYSVLYAELERIVDEQDEDAPVDFARWVVSRNPHNPYRCSACGYTANEQWATCPGCSASMRGEEE